MCWTKLVQLRPLAMTRKGTTCSKKVRLARLVQWNKHICLADKYSWDAVKCYTAEPLASDSGDEKHIKNVIKDGKQLQEENQKSAAAKWRARKPVQPDERSRHLVKEKCCSQFSEGMSSNNLSHDSQQVCFCCFQSGHFTCKCQSAVTSKASEWACDAAQHSWTCQEMGTVYHLCHCYRRNFLIIMVALLKNMNLYAMKYM